MAFNFNSSTQRNDTNGRGFVEAEGFINVTLNLPNQAPMKLPSLALQAKTHSSLNEWLLVDPSRVAKLLPYLVLDYKPNVKTTKILDFSALA